MRWREATVVACLLSLGCSSGTTLIVDVRTDLRPDFEFGSVELLLTRSDGSLARRSVVAVTRRDDFLAGERVAEVVGIAAGSYTADTRLLDENGDVVASRRTSLEIRDDLAVVVVITRDCRGLSCPAAGAPMLTECLGGRCVSPACAAGTASACPPPICETAAECASAVPCAPSICTLGLCFADPDDALCAAGQWCDPGAGCSLIAALDAGPRDAGPRDGGPHDAGPQDTGSTLDAGCVSGSPCDTGRDCEEGTWQCPGGTRTCVATGPSPTSRECRGASGDCDVAEHCDGSGTSCPRDDFASGGECRSSAGPCDRPESCDGSGPDCPPDTFYGSGRGCRAGNGTCDPGESCDGSGPDCPSDEVASNGTSCGAAWSELGCGPIDVSTCQGGSCVHDGAFQGNRPSCGAIGGFCGFTPQCCGSGGMFCVSGSGIYGSSHDCTQCCAVGSCCMDGNPAGPCI